MKVLYDFQTFTNQQYGGISRYFYELMHHFHETGEVQTDLGVKYTNNHYLTTSDYFKDLVSLPQNKTIDDMLWGINFKGKGKLFKYYSKLVGNIDVYGENKQFSLDKVKQGDFDVFHPTYFEEYFLSYLGNKPFVLTIYDMIHEIFPEHVDQVGTMFKSKRNLALKASKIIAISENTKNDIVKFYDVDAAKVEVVYLANSLDAQGPGNPDLKLPEKYILFVGNRALYKNFLVFAAAAAKLMKEDPELHVVCAGGGVLYAGERHYLDILGVGDRFVSAPADDASLVTCYKNALAFIYPSLYEGFGIPMLEAFACGTPVVSSNISSLPEVGGDAAVYFDPKDILSIKNALAGVIYDAEVRKKLIAKGLEREKQFSWQKTAEQTQAVYSSLV